LIPILLLSGFPRIASDVELLPSVVFAGGIITVFGRNFIPNDQNCSSIIGTSVATSCLVLSATAIAVVVPLSFNVGSFVVLIRFSNPSTVTISTSGATLQIWPQPVIAIGSPFGLENTVTAGIISASARDTGDYLPLIQTDVAVNPGNSGGPLINMRGEVIGINSQIYSRSGGYMGISFAVPIDEAMRVGEQLKTTGRVIRGRIGVQISDVSKEVAESLGLPRAQGALVARVEAGSPAEKAGVEAGDIITAFNGHAIEKSGDLPRLVGSTKPGSKGALTVLRKGTKRDLSVVVAEMEAEQVAKKKETNRCALVCAVSYLRARIVDCQVRSAKTHAHARRLVSRRPDHSSQSGGRKNTNA
jgi:hypothetical protein